MGASAVRIGTGTPEQWADGLVDDCQRELAGNLAHGAFATLALTLPEPDPAWLSPFAHTLDRRLLALGWSLVGGDTTRGPRCAVLTVNAPA